MACLVATCMSCNMRQHALCLPSSPCFTFEYDTLVCIDTLVSAGRTASKHTKPHGLRKACASLKPCSERMQQM
jgi:hypothetical protein